MIKGLSGQSIGAQIINATTGAAFAGAVTVYITGDAGVQAIGSVAGGVCTAEGNGYYTYRPATAETSYDLVAFTFIGAGAIPVTIQVATVTPAQTSALQTATGSASIVVLDLVTDALREIRVVNAIDPPDPNDAGFALRKLNRLLDKWNAQRAALYASSLSAYTLTPSLSPHTIGPNTATFAATLRPERIEGAQLIINNLGYPIDVRTPAWWLAQPNKTMTSTIPTDVAYEPNWPNGKLYFWPIPTAPYVVNLLLPVVLGALALTDVFWMPPAYQDALTLTLAESLARGLGVPLSPDLQTEAREARAIVFAANTTTPKLRTDTPGGDRRRSTWDYRIGMFR